MSAENVREHFQNEAAIYDDLIPRLIPYYREQGRLMVDLVDKDRGAPLTVLDLGAGTGALAKLILQTFPNATVHAVDLSANMLQACETNLAEFRERTSYQAGDFAHNDFATGYDLIVSGLSVHHLDTAGKKKLYERSYSALLPGGQLLNRDLVAGATDGLTKQYELLWREFMRSMGEDDEIWFAKYLEEDQPDSVEDQLGWLAKTGFAEVACHWRYLNFAIFGGLKPLR